MARLYANENFPFPVVLELRRLGHDVLTIGERGKAGQSVPDEAVLEFATGEQRAVVTLNRKHFIRLHAQRPGHAGVVAYTLDPGFPGQAAIDEAVRASQPLAGRLLRINRPA
jgi:hypothetical protein